MVAAGTARDHDHRGDPRRRPRLKEKCLVGPDHANPTYDLYSAWSKWCEKNGRNPGDSQHFGRDLKAALPSIEVNQQRVDGKRERCYKGIALH